MAASHEKKLSKGKKILFRVLSAPFFAVSICSALMVIFCVFNIGSDWWFGGLVGFLIIGAISGFIGLMVLSPSLDQPNPETLAKMERDRAERLERKRARRQEEAERRTRSEALAESHAHAVQESVANVSGSYSAKVYVYDPKPILKVKDGATFETTVVTRSITLRSGLTGGTWRTGTDDGYAIAYKGRPFGVLFNGIAETHIRKLLSDGAKDVRLTAVRQGWYQRGYPEVYVAVPTLQEAKDAEEASVAMKDMEQRQRLGFPIVGDLVFRIGETAWLRPRQVSEEGYATFNVQVELLPSEEGSSAKPHILLKDDSGLLAEITARSTATYNVLTPLVGKRLKLLVSKYFTSYNIEANEIQ